MTTLREAAQQALEALEKIADWHGAYGPFPENNEAWRGMAVVTARESVTALRAALAQPEPRNQCGETCERATLCAVCARGLEQEPVVVRAEALDLISEAAEVLDKVRVSCDAWEKYGLRDFLPDELAGTAGMLRDGSALTHPPRREWVSLTEDDVRSLYGKDLNYRDGDYARFAGAIEQALKERNT